MTVGMPMPSADVLRDWVAKGLVSADDLAPRAKPIAPRGPHKEGRTGSETKWTDGSGGDEPYVCVTVGVRTVNRTNAREHTRARAGRARREREATMLALIGVPESTRLALASGCIATLTRVSAGRLDELDGLGPALKSVRDAVAQFLFGGTPGQHDERPEVEWELRQLKGPPKAGGVIVSIRGRKA